MLSRKKAQGIIINGDIEIWIDKITSNTVLLAIKADKDKYPIFRTEKVLASKGD